MGFSSAWTKGFTWGFFASLHSCLTLHFSARFLKSLSCFSCKVSSSPARLPRPHAGFRLKVSDLLLCDCGGQLHNSQCGLCLSRALLPGLFNIQAWLAGCEARYVNDRGDHGDAVCPGPLLPRESALGFGSAVNFNSELTWCQAHTQPHRAGRTF